MRRVAGYLTACVMVGVLAPVAFATGAQAATTRECIFTTHTPVEAGHDRFSPDLIQFAMPKLQSSLGLDNAGLMALGFILHSKTAF